MTATPPENWRPPPKYVRVSAEEAQALAEAGHAHVLVTEGTAPPAIVVRGDGAAQGALMLMHRIREEEEQRPAREAAARAREAAFDAAWSRHADALARLQVQARGPLLAVVELHAPQVDDWGTEPTCAGCDYAGYEGEAPPWPCRTWTTATGQDP